MTTHTPTTRPSIRSTVLLWVGTFAGLATLNVGIPALVALVAAGVR